MIKRYFQAAYRSFFDARQYAAVLTEWKGIGALYLLLLSTVVSLAGVLFIAYGIYSFQQNELPHILKQLPVITIDKGEVSVDGTEPVIITGRAGNPFKFIIDTKATEKEFKDQGATVGLGKDFIVFKSRDVYQTKTLDNFRDKVVLTHDFIRKLVSNFLYLMPLVVYPLLVFSQFVGYLLQAFTVAILSYVVTALIKERLDFEARMRLSALALTPGTLISLLSLILIQHQTSGWLTILLAVLYSYSMLLLIRRLPKTGVIV